MKNRYKIAIIVIMIFIGKASFSQGNYKIIENDLKGKIEYDNSKKTDISKRVVVYYIYEVKIQSIIETKEKMQLIMKEFSQQFNLEENDFNFESSTWKIVAGYELSNDIIKTALDKYDYSPSFIKTQFGLKD